VTDAPTRTTADRFELRGELGSGGMGMVYRVFDRIRGEEVALKALRTTSGRDVYRFKREFRALADLVHPNLAALYELFTVGEEWMFTMELVHGVPFHRWVRPTGATGPVDQERLRTALIQLVDGLEGLHAAGKVHRDLKPTNVLVEPGGRVVILDFGLVADVEMISLDHTHEQTAVGTPAYMSPEQASDRALTPKSDWYSLGAMLYEILGGRRTFDGTAAQVLVAKQREDPPPLAEIAPDAPPALAALCMRMLARDPELRPTGGDILAMFQEKLSPWTRRISERAAHHHPVGCEKELAVLHQAVADSRDHCVSVLVLGPCGSGKTNLVDEFVEELKLTDAVVLRGRASNREALPFRAIDRIIDSLAAYLLSLPEDEARALAPPGIAQLAKVFPALRRVPAAQAPILPGMMPMDETELRRRAFGALCDLFRAISARHPLVIPLDDMQWGTAAGSRVMNDFFEGPDAPRCLIVFCHRTEDPTSPLLHHLGLWKGDLRTITLRALPPVLPEVTV